MGLKTLSLSEHFQWPKRNALSGFGLSVVVSLLICAVLFLGRSFNNPISLSFQTNPETQKLESFNDSNTPQVAKNSSLVETLNTSSREEEEEASKKFESFNDSNTPQVAINSSLVETLNTPSKEEEEEEKEEASKKFESLNDSDEPQLKNSSFVGLNNTSSEEEANETTRVNPASSFEECDFFGGKWVRDDSKPYYPGGSCPYIDRDFDCHYNRRPEDDYVKWRWQPNGCDIPSLNATDFLERLRGQKLVFVGDSLNRNMWESLVCILWNSVGDKKRVYEISGKTEFKKKGFYAFIFEDYNCTVDFVSAPFLVQESSFNGENGTFQTLRIDLMDRTTSMYVDADILIFNTGHWWTHEKTSKGEDYYQEGNYVHPRLKMLEAFTRALKTWAKWVDNNIDLNRTRVFFRGFSATHFRRGLWNSGGQCHEDTVPFNSTYVPKYNSKMRALDNVLREMKTPVSYLNISGLTGYRKDAHPAVYRMRYKSVSEQIAALNSQDCSHWCLPGVPDTWNELLYASLLRSK